MGCGSRGRTVVSKDQLSYQVKRKLTFLIGRREVPTMSLDLPCGLEEG